MRITRTRLIETTEIVDYFCNKCGETLSRDAHNGFGSDFLGIPNYTYIGSYHSGPHGKYKSKLQDCTAYNFSICEDCLSDFMDSFSIPPITDANLMAFDTHHQVDREMQNKINKVYKATEDELAIFMTDEDGTIRALAEARYKIMEKK